MSKLDTQWALAEIDALLHVTAQVNPNQPGSGTYYFGTVIRGPRTEASERAFVVEKILDRVLHGWRSKQPEKDTDYAWLRGQASRAKAALERAGELADRLGDGAPEMDAGALHPWAWDNGSSYWRTGHYHQAVLQAAIGVNAETQAKVGRTDVSEIDLFNQVFTLDAAKPGAPRLRLMADDGSKTYESLHRGARAFARVSTRRSATPACINPSNREKSTSPSSN